MKKTDSRAVRYGVLLAFLYVFVGGFYIYASTHFVSTYAASLRDMRYFELVKGLSFMLFSGGLLFVFSYFLFRRIELDSDKIIRQKEVLAEAGRRATAGVFAASVAHDSSNVLVSLRFCLELLERQKDMKGVNQELMETMKKAVDELSGLNRRLLDSSQQNLTGELERRDLVREIKGTLALARANLRVKFCDLALQGDEALMLNINPLLISEMVLNLVLNAGDATDGQGKIVVKAEKRGDAVCIEVHDDGPGIPPAERKRIFDVFFTTKKSGSGLGLLTVKACAELHKGSLQVGDSPLGGACFSVWLPLDASSR